MNPTDDPNIPAEVVLDRYLRNEPSLDQREAYRGKQDLALITDQSMRLLLEETQNSINTVYRIQRARILAQGTPPNLHFDYIDATVANAIAFGHDGYAFVGITMPMFNEVSHACGLLAYSEAIWTLFRSGKRTEQRRQLFTAFFAIQLQFIACHELGHHFHGHCSKASSSLWEEFLQEEPGSRDFLSQARELDADGFASHMLLRNLVAGPPREKLLELLGQSAKRWQQRPVLRI